MQQLDKQTLIAALRQLSPEEQSEVAAELQTLEFLRSTQATPSSKTRRQALQHLTGIGADVPNKPDDATRRRRIEEARTERYGG